jgi:hypothetical protein
MGPKIDTAVAIIVYLPNCSGEYNLVVIGDDSIAIICAIIDPLASIEKDAKNLLLLNKSDSFLFIH